MFCKKLINFKFKNNSLVSSFIFLLQNIHPCDQGYTPNVRLDKTDADFVDVIHSNGDSLIIGGLGAWEPIGHVDFYPNGGKAQRGCQNLLIGGLYDFIYCEYIEAYFQAFSAMI